MLPVPPDSHGKGNMDPGFRRDDVEKAPCGAFFHVYVLVGRARQRSSNGSLSGLPSHSLASGSGSLRVVITGQARDSSALSAT